MLGTFHYLADVRGANRWTTVFLWLGANAITIYLMNNILDFSRLALRLAGGDVGSFFDRYLTYGTGRLVPPWRWPWRSYWRASSIAAAFSCGSKNRN